MDNGQCVNVSNTLVIDPLLRSLSIVPCPLIIEHYLVPVQIHAGFLGIGFPARDPERETGQRLPHSLHALVEPRHEPPE